MNRYLYDPVKKDLGRKAILLSGPRQVGKTTFARSLTADHEYLNYDIVADRKLIMSQAWSKNARVVVLDEIHKFKKWKNLLKGVIDEYQNTPALLVTGSARLEIFRKAGDALTGRTFSYHLHPIDIAEACALLPETPAEKHLEHLLEHGGFPESFFHPSDSRRLLQDRLSTVLREDLRDLSLVTNLKSIELLVELLRDRASGQITFANLASDLSVSPPTVKAWIELLEKLYLIFLLRPYSSKIAKSLRKEPKCYFFDCGAATNGEAARLENLAALALLKWCDLMRDTKGRNLKLNYYRDSNNHEVDFVITEDLKVLACIEVKTSDEAISPSLTYLAERLRPRHAIQLVKNCTRERDLGLIKVRSLAHWLGNIKI
jgi:predicted AAA+ superfamily ATPase